MEIPWICTALVIGLIILAALGVVSPWAPLIHPLVLFGASVVLFLSAGVTYKAITPSQTTKKET